MKKYALSIICIILVIAALVVGSVALARSYETQPQKYGLLPTPTPVVLQGGNATIATENVTTLNILGNSTIAGNLTSDSAPVQLGFFIQKDYLTSPTNATFTTSANTHKIVIELIGGGGGGGGSSNTTANVSAGSGGGSGASTFVVLSVSPSTGYSYQVGAGGAGGASQNTTNAAGNAGTAGSPSWFYAVSTNYTANGGAKGAGSLAPSSGLVASLLGGNGGSASANGDLREAGNNGGVAIYLSSTLGKSGDGAGSVLGNAVSGNSTAAAGNAGTGYGDGGAGATSTTTTPYAGGAGYQGVIIITEYQ